jgi:predicted Zn-dependent peptidase
MPEMTSAQIDRSKQPAPDPAPTITFPPYEEFTLKNGLKVFFVHDERPLVTLRMLVRGGNGQDGDLPGLTDAVAELITKGSGGLTAQEFAQQIDFIGGNVGASASPDAINISAGGLRKHTDKILDLFASVVKSPTYPADELEKYRQEQISGLKSAKARSEFLADYAVNRVLYGNTPYGAMPSEDALRKLTPEKIKEYYNAYFVPSNATLAVVGNYTLDELHSMVEKAFGDWRTGNSPTIKAPSFPDRKGRRFILVDRPTSVQSSIRVIGKGPLLRDPERPMTSVLNSVLGGGTGLGNRLAANLRETHAYTYTPYSLFDANYYMGHWLAGADVRNAVTDSALAEIFHEVDRIQTEPIPQEELQRNIQSSVGNYLMSVADPKTTAIRVQSIDFYGLPKNYYQKLVAAYQATTPDLALSLAKKYLDSNDLAVVVVGKASEVKPKLERFGKVEVWDANLNPVGSNAGLAQDLGITATQAWDRMLAAMGGKEKLRSVKTMKTTGKVEGNFNGQKFGGSIMKVEAAPNKMYQILDLGVFKTETVVDGKNARQGNGGPLQPVTGEELEGMLESSHILSEAYIADLKGKLALTGAGERDGKKVYNVEVSLPKGGSTVYVLDASTFLPVAQESESSGTVTLGDWKTVDGLKLAGTIGIEPGNGAHITMKDLNYEVNKTIDQKLFDKK